MTPDRYQCTYCGTTYPVPSLARDCCTEGEEMPKPTTCPVVIGTTKCESGQRIVKGLCLYHYKQLTRGQQLTAWKYTRSPGATSERDAEGNKQCGRCTNWLPVDRFNGNARCADGLQVWCKQCTADDMSVKRYGFARDVVLARVAEQGGCAICKCAEPSGNGYRSGWHVDHDHACCPGTKTCGKCIRSILCARCNKILGAVNDDPDLLIAAAQYLRDCEHRHEKETAP